MDIGAAGTAQATAARLCAIGVAALACAGAAAPTELAVTTDGLVPGTIDGMPARFRMTADGLSYPVLDAAVAQRLALGSSFFSVQARVGSVRIPGRTGVVTIGVGATSQKRRALWFERPGVDGADAALGPDSVAATRVVFRLRPPRTGERDYALPLVAKGGRLGTAARAGAAVIFVLFHLERRRTLASAAAAADLAASNGAVLAGAARMEPIRFGIARPVRDLALASPLAVGPLRLSSLAARVADGGAAAGIPDADADPGEVVVVGRRGKDRSEHVLSIGTDDLAACSSITFDKAARRITLSGA